MPRTSLAPADLHLIRDDVERVLNTVVDKALRGFLRQVERAALNSPLRASGRDDLLTLGETSGWWTNTVDTQITSAIREEWMRVYRDVGGGVITATSLDGLEDYMGRVRDRLVRGLIPPIGEDAFDKVRLSITQGTVEGWTRKQTAQRIAAELGWETNGPYWRAELSRIDGAIDRLLDPLGPPGHPIREAARLRDPRVAALQADRSIAVKHLDAERPYWQVRANRIARTEATGANNYAHLAALHDEGRTGKEWVAAGDARTRPTHSDASGQIVPLGKPFDVGGSRMMYPGDPSAPAAETVNCRCVITGADLPDESATTTAAVPDVTAFNTKWADFRDDLPDGAIYAQTGTHELRYASSFTDEEWETWADEIGEADRIAHFDVEAIRAVPTDDLEDMVSGWDNYISTGFHDINRALRGVEADDLDRVFQTGDIARMDAMFDHVAPTLTEPTFLFRYLESTPDFDPLRFVVGETFTDHAFVSTTLGQGRVEAFGNWSFLIRVPEGTRVLFGDSDEWEVILDRGSRFRVLSVDHEEHRVNVEYLGTVPKTPWEA